jgi:hypothetical protein
MYARPLFVVVGIFRAFSSEVGTGSRQENASDYACFGPFRLLFTDVLTLRLGIP